MPDPYLSPFAWRYGSEAMRAIWSEVNTRRLYRRIWVALARVQSRYGLVTPEQVADLEAHADEVDLEASLREEQTLRHDLMAEVRVYAAQCPQGGGIIHLGATSMDVKDNASALQTLAALTLLLQRVDELLLAFVAAIETYADLPCLGYTHLQPAEPTTLGYRLAAYAQDLWEDRQALRQLQAHWRGKGFKGAVGTSASYALLLAGRTDPATFEAEVLAELGLTAWPIANQTYPRRQDWALLTALAGLGLTLYRFAFDLRLLQNPALGEWAEPFGAQQVGSSAMPFKRNPIAAEKLDSLARYLARLPDVAWDNAAHSLLERTLDDSANRRIILPEGFLAAEEIVLTALRLVRGLRVQPLAIARNLERYGVFSALEPLLMRLVQAGADRQAMHEILRELALQAWAAMEAGEANPLPTLVTEDPRLQRWLSATELREALTIANYLGDAPQRARALAQRLRTELASS